MSRPHRSQLLSQVKELTTSIGLALPELAEALDEIDGRMDEPLRVAIAGKVKAGKSTLLNALLGEELAASDAGECTRIVTWYQHGDTYDVIAQAHGENVPVRFDRDGGTLTVDLLGNDADDIDQLTVYAPAAGLETMSLIDTPGMASLSTDIAQKSTDFLAPDDGSDTPVDAVIYLLRHLHATDVSFLHAFHDKEFASPSPVNCLGILSRSDEIAAGRLDAMESANRIATRYSADPRLRRLVQGVVPVAGLIGQASATLDDHDVADLKSIASAAESTTQLALLSIDRFLSADDIGVSKDRRKTLLTTFGLFGLRLVEQRLRSGAVTDHSSIRSLLRSESGIDHLSDTLMVLFGGRRDTLKARSALVAIQRLVDQTEPPRSVSADLERVWAGAHEFAELRTLNVIRDTNIGLSAEQLEEAEQILGGFGTSLQQRLGTSDAASPAECNTLLLAAISQWRQLASSPVASRSLTALAEVVIRSAEGLVAQLDT